jgi:diguanylate cyclase (GGDEF)-like protein
MRKLISTPSKKLIFRLYVIPSILCFFILLSLGLVLQNQRKGELIDLENRSRLQANLLAEKIAGKLNGLELVLSMISQETNSLDLKNPEDLQNLISQIKSQLFLHEDLEGLCLIAPDGSKYYSSFHADNKTLEEAKNRMLEAHTKQNLPFNLLPFIDHGVGHLVLSRSLFDKSGNLVAIAGLVKQTDSFFDLLSQAEIPGLNQAVVFDASQNTIARWNRPDALETVMPTHMLDIPVFANSSILKPQWDTIQAENKTLEFEGSLLTTIKLEGLPLTLGMETLKNQAMYSYDKVQFFSLLGMFLFIIISLTVIILLGNQVIENEKLQQDLMADLTEKVRLRTAELEQQSNIDSLTGLINRRKINTILAEEIDKGLHNEEVCSVMLIDIDHFKLVNDSFGHQTGDAVLIHIATLLKNNLEGYGTLSRWGGDELLAFLPSQTVQETFDMAQTLLALIIDNPFSKEIHHTLSIGIAQHKRGESSASLIHRADTALYQAKASGRNKAICN